MKVRVVAVALALLLVLASATVFAQSDESGEGEGESESAFTSEAGEGSATGDGESADNESTFESSFESGESDGSHGPRCGRQGDGKTCQQLGMAANVCCAGSGYCSAAPYACNKKLGCQSGPCKRGFNGESSGSEPVAAEESAESSAPPKTITKVISNAVPLCASCGSRGFQSATDDYSLSSGSANLYIDSSAPASVQAQQAQLLAGSLSSAQAPMSAQMANAVQQQMALTGSSSNLISGSSPINSAALGASMNPLASVPDPTNQSDLIKRIQLEGTLRTKAILDAANTAASQIVGTANQVGSKGRGKPHKKKFLVPVEASKKKGGVLVPPIADRKKETSDMKLPEF